MNSKKFFNERRFILSCCKINLEKNDLCQIEEIVNKPLDWSFLWEQSLYHGITCFLYLNFKKAGLNDKIPAEVYVKFEDFYNSTLLKNLLLWNEFCNIYDLLLRNKIIVVPIKGIMLNEIIYKNKNFRPMEDIDLLIQKRYVQKVEMLLNSFGYKKSELDYSEDYYRNYYYHIPLRKKYLCEIHWDIAAQRPYKINLSSLWNNLKEYHINGINISILSPEDNFFTLVLHLRRFNLPLSLRYICDISELIKLYKNEFNWDYIIRETENNRIMSTVYFALFSAHELLNTPVPQDILNRFDPGKIRKKCLQYLIKDKTFSLNIKRPFKRRYIYVFLRYLIYDKIHDFLFYIQFIPLEEFARFYSLPLRSKKTLLLYHLRVIYILFRLPLDIVNIVIEKFKSISKS